MEYAVNTKNRNNRTAMGYSNAVDWKAISIVKDKALDASKEQAIELSISLLKEIAHCWAQDGNYLKKTGVAVDDWARSLSVIPRQIEETEMGKESTVLKTLEKYFIVENTLGVEEITNKYKLLPFLTEAGEEFKKKFGNKVKILLSLIDDPEFSSERFLFAKIYTDLSVDDALSRIEELDKGWFLKNIKKAAGVFNFDVEWK